jgi:hypothetical protein
LIGGIITWYFSRRYYMKASEDLEKEASELLSLSNKKPVKKGLATLYHPLILLVGAEGFEPPTPCSQSKCATRLRHAPIQGFSIYPKTFEIKAENGIFCLLTLFSCVLNNGPGNRFCFRVKSWKTSRTIRMTER